LKSDGMLLLVVDSSGRQGSVALAACGEETTRCEIVDCEALTGGMFSAELVPRIASLLSKHGYSLKQIDGFVVASGPGSFTGLRIGLAAIKGLAEVLGKPIAAVSLLEALAIGSRIEGLVFAAIDAGRSELYIGEYELHGNEAKLIRERIVNRDELSAVVSAGTVVVSDDVLAGLLKESGVVEIKLVTSLNIQAIGILGYQKIRLGQIVTSENLEANYIRRSDPEVLRDKQSLART
jgi:tRNA threonylcarbamoyladenosine biosynthesis protein TsaB